MLRYWYCYLYHLFWL